MESQEELNLGIGNEEAQKLQPKKVQIIGIEIREVGGQKKGKIVKAICMHPDKSEAIMIDNVKYVVADKIVEKALWVNKDSKGLIRKDSALAVLMRQIGAATIEQLKGKMIDTALGDKGYLAFKGY